MGLMAPALEHALPKSMEAPAMAREAIRRLEGQVSAEMVDDATLLVSELMTNAVKYGGEGGLRLEIDIEADRLRAEIIDQGDGFEPRTRTERRLVLSDEGGWGLHLVESLADEWGVHEGSTHVWFELRRQ
jgi:anti-sigma regulatory factor (Ser/Thr protein kinase)